MYTITDLLYLMVRLRDPKTGCPWDVKQVFTSITDSTLEEAYELVDAIEQGNMQQVKEELGDVLFQVVFHAQMANEKTLFDFEQVVDDLVNKLVRRHPHVFPSGDLYALHEVALTDAEVIHQWEEIKQQERKAKALNGVFDDIPHALPALGRAAKIQKRMSKFGFDWETLEPVIDKLNEEVSELKAAIATNNKDDMAEEVGDMLFSCVNIARHLGLDAEKCLRLTNRKVARRFSYIESELEQAGTDLHQAAIDEMERLWRLSKLHGES